MSDIFADLASLGAEPEDALERFMQDKEMYKKYIRAFPEEPTMKALKKAVAEKDYEAAEREVHALKGIVNNLGLIPLADATVDMLEELRDGDIGAALAAYEELEREYDKFSKIIKAWRE